MSHETRKNLHNPLWLPKGAGEKIQEIPSTNQTPLQLLLAREEFAQKFTPLQKELEEHLQKEGIKRRIPCSEDGFLVPRLNFTENNGTGPIYGEMGTQTYPDLRNLHKISNRASIDGAAKRLDYWWPLCPITGNRMAYLGYLHLDYYLTVFHEATRWESHGKQISMLGEHAQEAAHRLHFFIGSKEEEPGWNRNAHTAIETLPRNVPNQNLMELEDYQEAIQKILDEKPVIDTPLLELDQITLGEPNLDFDVEILPNPDTWGEHYIKLPSEENKWKQHMNDKFKVFGSPKCEQLPKRPICPNRFPKLRGLCPVVSYKDPNQDSSHQIYQDLMDDHPASYGMHETSKT